MKRISDLVGAGRPLSGSLPASRRLLAVSIGAALAGSIAVVDSVAGAEAIVIGTIVLAPFLVALIGEPAETVATGLCAVVLAAISGTWNENFGEWPYFMRLAAVALGSIVAVVAARGRSRSRAATERFGVLSGLAETLTEGLDLPSTVARIQRTLVPSFADVCVIDAVRGERLDRVGVLATGAHRDRIEAYFAERGTVGRQRDAGTGDAAPQLLSDLAGSALEAVARDQADLAHLRAVAPTSALVVPLHAGGAHIGTLTLLLTEHSGRHYTEDELRFATVAAGRVALALDNSGLSREVIALERQLDASLGRLAEAVSVVGRDRRPVYANQAAADLVGAADGDEYCATDPTELWGRFEVFDEHGRPVGFDELPAAQVFAGELSPAPKLVRSVFKPTGRERWLVNKTSPVVNDHGEVIRVVNVIEDVTEFKRAERDQRLLAEASETLFSSLDYAHTLQTVAELAVPEIADWCSVSLPDGRGFIRTVAVAHRDPGRIELALGLRDRYPTPESADYGVAKVLATGETEWIDEITPEMLELAAEDSEHLEILRGLGLRAAISVPLKTPVETIGVLTLVSAESHRTFAEADLKLAEELARRAALAVENARVFSERSHIAATLERGLRPTTMPAIPGWRAASMYRPAGRHTDIGGDFYDAFEVDGGWMVVMGDVTGHGAEAATLTSLCRYTLRTAAELTGDPKAALDRLNRTLLERDQMSLATAACLYLPEPNGGGEKTVSVASAGHPLPIRLRDGEVTRLGSHAELLGAFEGARWRLHETDLRAGDTLLVYTDGLVDTSNRGERFGEERLEALVRGGAGDPTALIAKIEAELAVFASDDQRDDVAALALTFRGPRAS